MSITKEVLVEKMKGSGSVVLNVLPEAEFLNMHIQGSHSLPLLRDRKAFIQEVKDRFGCDKAFVTYASNITSHDSIDAAEALVNEGIRAESYLSGMKEWAQAGLPTEGLLVKV